MGKVDFEQMFTMFSERLKIVAYSVTKDWYIAEDVVQESFIKAYKKLDSIEDTDKVSSWLSAITVRTAIDFVRAEKRRKWMAVEQDFIEYIQFQVETSMSTEEEVEILLLKEEVNNSILQLAEQYKQVLQLKVEHGLKEAEIASALQLKSTTVKTRLHRARKQLKQAMSEKYSA